MQHEDGLAIKQTDKEFESMLLTRIAPRSIQSPTLPQSVHEFFFPLPILIRTLKTSSGHSMSWPILSLSFPRKGGFPTPPTTERSKWPKLLESMRQMHLTRCLVASSLWKGACSLLEPATQARLRATILQILDALLGMSLVRGSLSPKRAHHVS